MFTHNILSYISNRDFLFSEKSNIISILSLYFLKKESMSLDLYDIIELLWQLE